MFKSYLTQDDDKKIYFRGVYKSLKNAIRFTKKQFDEYLKVLQAVGKSDKSFKFFVIDIYEGVNVFEMIKE